MYELLLLRNYFVEDLKRICGDNHYYYYNDKYLEELYLESIKQIDKILSDSSIPDPFKKKKYLEYISELWHNWHNNVGLMSHLVSDDYDKLLWIICKFLNVSESEILLHSDQEQHERT